jgi:hypothetical protein
MNHVRYRKGYRLEDLVVAAYNAAHETTSNQAVAAIIVTKVLEDWLRKSGRMDLVAQLRSALL